MASNKIEAISVELTELLQAAEKNIQVTRLYKNEVASYAALFHKQMLLTYITERYDLKEGDQIDRTGIIIRIKDDESE